MIYTLVKNSLTAYATVIDNFNFNIFNDFLEEILILELHKNSIILLYIIYFLIKI